MERTLGKTERLHKRDFRFARWAKSGRTPHFLLFKNDKGQPITRFGVVVSRKIKGAVRRNRIKRLLREFFRLNKQLFGASTAYSIRVMGHARGGDLRCRQPGAFAFGDKGCQAMTTIALFVLRLYRLCISPYLPTTCRFSPTCSCYMMEALEKKGFWRGLSLGLIGSSSATPFTQGDSIP